MTPNLAVRLKSRHDCGAGISPSARTSANAPVSAILLCSVKLWRAKSPNYMLRGPLHDSAGYRSRQISAPSASWLRRRANRRTRWLPRRLSSREPWVDSIAAQMGRGDGARGIAFFLTRS